jgi:eight-cysteine-cluster-containing protein
MAFVAKRGLKIVALRMLVIQSVLLLFFLPIVTATMDPQCQIGGCSNQLCQLKGSDSSGTCVFKHYYSCFEEQQARCTYANGRCRWKGTRGLKQCLVDRNADSSVIDNLFFARSQCRNYYK